MTRLSKNSLIAISLIAPALLNIATASDVKILAADLHNSHGNIWSVRVTLKHGDSGWDHYADNWRVVDGENNILGDRVLYHPHINEQPFTRGLGNVKIADGTTIVYIEAHDKVHGWTSNRLKIDLLKASDGRLKILAK